MNNKKVTPAMKQYWDIKRNYEKVYPRGSQPARLYGLPKLHKMSDVDIYPKFRPIISSTLTYILTTKALITLQYIHFWVFNKL